MITVDMRKQSISFEELFRAADSDDVLIVTNNGQEYILEAVDEFEQEVAQLSRSEKFMNFLAERRKETRRIPLEEVERRLKPLSE
jgi:PHD/YefM family antitoxin component YafN of YafNO toxin-antitoxin module